MRRRSAPAPPILALLALAATAVGPSPKAWALSAYRIPEPEVRMLDNGLEVAVFRDPRLAIVQIEFAVSAGSAVEPAGQGGVAQITAELLRRGTTSRDEVTFGQDLTRLGGTMVTSASRDRAVVSGAFLARDLEAGLELMSDAVVYPVFDDAAFQRSVAARIRSLNPFRMSATTLAGEAAWSAAFGSHPYGRSPAGTEASLKGLTLEQVRAFHRDHYLPAGSVLAIAGDVAPERAFTAAREWFGRWPARAAAPAPRPVAPSAPAVIRVIDRAGPRAELLFAAATAGRGDRDELPLSIAEIALASGEGSRLGREALTTIGRVPVPSAVVLRDAGLFTIDFATSSDSVGAAAKVVRSALQRLGSDPPSETEVAAAKRVTRGALSLALETLGGLLGRWATAALDGAPDATMGRFPARLDSVSVAGVAAAARRWLDPGRFSIVAIGPAATIKPQLAALGAVEVVTLAEPGSESSTPTAKPASPAAKARGKRLVGLALTAHGGAARLRAIQDMTLAAKMMLVIGGKNVDGRLEQMCKEPYRMVYSTSIGGLETRQTLDGDRAWSATRSDPTPTEIDSNGVRALRAGFDTDVPHLLLAAQAGTAVDRGRRTIDGRAVESVEVQSAGGPRRMLYFDPVSHRLVAMDQHESRDPSAYSARRIYRDYRPAHGVSWPFEEDRYLNGELVMHLAYTRVTINSGLDESLFEKPEGPLTAPAR